MNNTDLIIRLLFELSKHKYKNIKWYCHNLANYDHYFIFKALSVYNEDKDNMNKINVKFGFRDQDIIKLTFNFEIDGDKRKVVIVDSLPLLNNKLKDLTIAYELDSIKGVFPHSFASDRTLFYKCNTPDFIHYQKYWDIETYKTNNWDFKHESNKYLYDDIKGLYEVLKKAEQEIFEIFDVHLSLSSTISSLALQIFMKNYYIPGSIPSIKMSDVYKDIKSAYFRGITEVYKPFGKDLYYYDVNSLYPFVALNSMPGTECYKHETFDSKINLDQLFGFYSCEIVKTNESYLGLLPVINEKGVFYPIGKWSDWYFSEELKFARKIGYKITVLSGYTFNREDNVFKKYIESIYDIKSNPKNSVQRALAKSLLNNLLGRFGIDLNKPVTKVVSNKEFQ